MASTYTANLGVEKIGSGEQSGTWGTTTNLNLDIIDRAINGVVAISLSSTSHTLSTTDGALSEGGHKLLNLSGGSGSYNREAINAHLKRTRNSRSGKRAYENLFNSPQRSKLYDFNPETMVDW